MATRISTTVALTVIAALSLSGCPSGGDGSDSAVPVAGPPVDMPPVGDLPDDTPPVDSPPVDDAPIDTPPADDSPGDGPSIDTPPVDDFPDDVPANDTPPADDSPDDVPSNDTPPADDYPDDVPPDDTPPADDLPDDPDSGNSPPSLAGTPSSSTKVGEVWSFTPDASDPDGDALTFVVENQPGWTDFDASSGALSGEPQAEDEGSYEDIAIVASDGTATDSLRFSVTVTQVAAGSVTVSWVPPTLNEDGSPLTDLSSFKIHYGRSSGTYTEQILIDNPGTSTYLLENLTPGTYYFATTAINSSGVESDYSSEAVTTVN